MVGLNLELPSQLSKSASRAFSFVMDLDYSVPVFVNSALLFVNLAMFVVFTAFGIVMCVYRRRKAKRAALLEKTDGGYDDGVDAEEEGEDDSAFEGE